MANSVGYQPINCKSFQNDIEIVRPVENNQHFDISNYGDKASTKKTTIMRVALIIIVNLILSAFAFYQNVPKALPSVPEGSIAPDSQMFDHLGRYVMHNFDQKKPMANFLSGLSGFWGVPMWTFYVNRGQGITSFGIQNKDGMIEKFQSAEKAYFLAPFTGFRTFVKGKRGSESFSHMPFFPQGLADVPKEATFQRNMMIDSNEMEIEEIAPSLNLKTNILYFNLPDEEFASLVRRTTFTNMDASETLTLDVLDGLDKLVPSGLSNNYIDSMGRLAEAYMNVYNVGDRVNIKEPFFHISQGTGDTAEVQIIKEGHFTVAFIEDVKGVHDTLPFIVDPDVVFGFDTSMTDPKGFFGPNAPDSIGISNLAQVTTSRTPCAFAAAKLVIPPGGSVTVTSVYGHADTLEKFVNNYSPMIRQAGYITKKRAASSKLVDEITKKVKTSTSSALLNAYIKQDYLDNSLRGGVPLILGDPENPKILHTFNRVHGDIERDYNWFNLEPTFFSQGPGNFRDVNQNRRNDVLITPAVGDFNIRMFLSFVQSDGYNPLQVATTNFKVADDKVEALVAELGIIEKYDVSDTSGAPTASHTATMKGILVKPFRIGQLFHDMKAIGIESNVERNEFLRKIMVVTDQASAAAYMQNGYWCDHWTYTLDMVDSYLAIFPDKEDHLLYSSEPVPFYLSPAVVRARADRYKIVPNSNKPGTSTVRVYSAVSAWDDKDFPSGKKLEMLAIKASPNYMGYPSGEGAIWQRTPGGADVKVTVISKLIILGTLKFSTLDPYGMGVEMEGGKPGWNDAMNGLPGIIGSGVPETFEMLRIIKYVKQALVKFNKPVVFPAEFSEFLHGTKAALVGFDASPKGDTDQFKYWDSANYAREKYRALTNTTYSGEMAEMSSAYLIDLLASMEKKTLAGIVKALATNNGLSPTYFSYDCVDFTTVSGKVYCKEFKMHTLPLFLEGPVRHMKIVDDQARAREILRLAKASNLYDTKLQMYTLSESLSEMGPEVGRMKAFSPGWLENQSIFLHMSYKFYLEILRAGLYKEFYEEIKTGLVPFMDNEVYGRSPLEAASFLVSSAFPDAKLHGASFMARLSGSTAEFLSMWQIMMMGKTPFTLDSTGQLQLHFSPALPGWLFNDDGSASFTFLGAVEVVYHNPMKVDSWTTSPKSASVMYADGSVASSSDAVIRGSMAEDVRAFKVTSVNVYF